jgi:hypothetical protein
MAHHVLQMPVTEAQVRALRINDTVTLQRTLYGIRDATQIHMFDRDRRTRLDLHGHAVIHTAPNVRKVPVSADHPAGYAPVCIGTTTSDRMERFTRPLMAREGVRLIIGKGGCATARPQPSPRWAAPTSPSSAAPRRWRRPGSSRSRTWTWTTSTPRACGACASATSAAAGGDGQPRRQPVPHRAGRHRGAARAGAGVAGGAGMSTIRVCRSGSLPPGGTAQRAKEVA